MLSWDGEFPGPIGTEQPLARPPTQCCPTDFGLLSWLKRIPLPHFEQPASRLLPIRPFLPLYESRTMHCFSLSLGFAQSIWLGVVLLQQLTTHTTVPQARSRLMLTT